MAPAAVRLRFRAQRHRVIAAPFVRCVLHEARWCEASRIGQQLLKKHRVLISIGTRRCHA